MDFIEDAGAYRREYPTTYRTFRCLFNKNTCPDLAGVEIIAPEKETHSWSYTNIGRMDIDDRLISMIDFSIVEKEYPRGEKGIKATVYLAEK